MGNDISGWFAPSSSYSLSLEGTRRKIEKVREAPISRSNGILSRVPPLSVTTAISIAGDGGHRNRKHSLIHPSPRPRSPHPHYYLPTSSHSFPQVKSVPSITQIRRNFFRLEAKVCKRLLLSSLRSYRFVVIADMAGRNDSS